MTKDDHDYGSPLTYEELHIAFALMGCPESKLYQGSERLTLAQIGSLMGVTREAVRLSESKALRKLRYKLAYDTELRGFFLQLFN